MLYFTDQHVQRARNHRKQSPLKEAWDQLDNAPDSPLARVQWYGLRYRFQADSESGEAGNAALRDVLQAAPPDDPWEAPAHYLAVAHCIALLRDHPAYDAQTLPVFLTSIHTPEGERTLVESIWWLALDTAVAILTADSDRLADCVTGFKVFINEAVHPEGYLPQAVEVAPETASLQAQIRAVQGLVLIAEMASHAGHDLWRYEQRGVSILTATTYPLYYYFYPENWPWNGEKWKPSDGVPEDAVKAIFRQHAGFLEMIASRYDRPLKAVSLILDDLRPVVDVYGGGLVTLSHAKPRRRGLFG